MRKFPKIITSVLFWGLVCVPVSGFAEKNTNLPQNPNVINGSANFIKEGNKLTINQNSDKLITNWSSFNIGKDNKVEFKQPDIASTALNRVNSNDPTHIYGTLKSNGKIILINPNGVLFKDGARVDVGSIIASTLNLKDKDFIDDKYVFEKDGFSGVVNNQGEIKALEGGTIAIIAPQVENKGEIETTNGTVALISGEKVKLSLNGNSLIQYSIERGVLNALIDNKQALKVDDGTIILSAKGVKEVKNAVIKNSGSLRADGITKKGGKIYLSASNGKVLNSGVIAANSQQNKGGSVRVTAENIHIDENSKISTVGKKSGGSIEIGGSWQNSNEDVFQATKTTIAEGTILDASAFDMGDGGEIVVWSDIHNSNSKTTVKGILKAEGGKIKGNGGRIETSGRALDIDEITISTKSVDGVDGQWLIDPYDITISSGSDTNISGSFSASDNDAVINVGTLETALSSSNVTVTTAGGGFQSGDITVNAAITSSSSNDLTLDADRHIFINQNITRSGSGGLILEPGSNNVSGSGTINLAAGSSITTSTDAIVSPNINLSSTGDVNFTGSGTTTYSGSISGSGNLNKTGSGTVILSGSNSYTGSTKVNAGTLRVNNTNSVPSNNSLVSSGGTYYVNSSVELAGLSGSGDISISSGNTLTLNNSSMGSFSGVISGNGGFTKNGSGSFTLLNNNTYTGATTISGGELTAKGLLGNTNISLATGTILGFDAGDDTIGSISGSGFIDIPSGMTITSNASTGSTTFSGDLSGDGNFIKDGNYTLTLSGSNSITGTKTINGGTLSISSDDNLGAVPGSVQSGHLVFDGGTLQTTAGFTLNSNRGINLSGNGTINTNPSTQLNYGGQIQGSGNLTKDGAGTLSLSGANNFSGNLNIDGGTLSASAVDQLGRTTGSNVITFDGGTLFATSDFTLDSSRSISLEGNGTFNVDDGVTLDYAGVISGSGALTKSGTGNFQLSGANTYSGNTNITAGTLQTTGTLADTTEVSVSTGGLYDVDEDDIIRSLAGDGNINIASLKTLQTGHTNDKTISGIISGAGSLVKLGSGKLTLSGMNTNTGSVGIQAGTLSISTDRNLGAVPGSVVADSIIFNGGTLQSTGTTSLDSNRGLTIYASSTIDVDGSGTELTVPGIITGSAGANLSKTGLGTLTLDGVNTYAGSTAINGGTLGIRADSGLGAVPGSTTADHLTINGGTLQTTADVNLETNRGITLGASGGTINTGSTTRIRYMGVISGSGDLTKTGDGRLWLFLGNHTYSGDTIISDGTLNVVGTLADTTYVSVASGATYDVDSTDTINSLEGEGNVELSSGVTLTTGGANNNKTISGVISGAGNLVKTGSGTLTLSGTNTYTGTTTISSGTLNILADSGLGAAPGSATPGHLTLNGGTLRTPNTFTLNSNRGITLGSSHGTFNVHGSSALTYGGIIAGSNNLTKSGNGSLILSGSNTYSGITTITSGTVSITSSDNLGPNPGSLDADNIILDGGILKATTSFTLGDNKGITLNAASTIEVDDSSSILTYPGTITGSRGYFKTGAGTLLLSGTNTYTGYTNIDAGKVQVTGTLSSSTTVDNEGIFDVDKTNTVASVFGSGNVELASGITLTTGDTNNRTISGVVSGSGNLVKTGSGTLTLSGTNTYTGTTTISTGTLTVSGLLGSGTHSSNIINNSTLNYTSSSNQNLSGVISGTGLLTQNGSGTLTLSDLNTYSGTTTINSGTISISLDTGLGTAPGSATAGHLTINGGTLQSTTDFTLDSNRGVALGSSHGTFNVDTGTTLTVAGVVAGSNNLIKAGDGRLILSGVNTYSGNTTISAGTFEVSGLLGSGNYSGNISNSGTFDYSSSSNQTISGVISGSGDIVKGGTGELTLSGSNTYSQMTMNDGYIIISSDSGLGAPPGSATPGHLTFNGGTLQTTASFTLNSNRGINLISQGTIITDPGTTLTYGGIIAGSGNLIKAGTGTLVLTGSNTNTGFVGIQEGVLSVSSAANLGAIPGSVDSDNIQMINGTLHVTSSFDLDANKGILLQSGFGSAAAIFDIDLGQTLTIPGVISGNGTASITKNGSGTLTLSGTNTHTATTNINAGKMIISADTGLGAAPGSATAGHLTLNGGTLETTADFTLNSNRGIALGASNGIIDVNSGTTLTYGGIMTGSGTLTKVDAGTLTLSGVNTYSGSSTINGGTINISADTGLGAAPGSATAGHLTLNGGTLHSSADFTLNSNRGIALGNSHGTINVDGSTTLAYGGIIAGSNNLTKTGSGTLRLSGTNTLTGSTTISAGTLQLGNNTSTGSMNSSSIINNSALVLDFSNDITLSSDISGTGTLYVTARYFDLYDSGSGSSLSTSSWTQIATSTTVTEVLQRIAGGYMHGEWITDDDIAESGISVREYDPITNTASFRIRFNHDSGGTDYTKQVTVDLRQNGSNVEAKIDDSQKNYTSGGVNLTSNNYTNLGEDDSGSGLDGDITYATSETASGYGLRKLNSSVKATLTGALTYSGATTIQKNTIDGSQSVTGGDTVYYKKYVNATLEIGGSGSLTSSAVNNDGNFIFSSGSNFTLNTVISGAGTLIHDGSNVSTLSANNTYTGATYINAGAINATHNNALGTTAGTTTILSGAALNLSNNINIGEAITISGTGVSNNGAIRNVSDSNTLSGLITLAANSEIQVDTGSTLTMDVASGNAIAGTYNLTIDSVGTSLVADPIATSTGTLTKTGAGTLTLSGVNTYSGSTTINAGTISIDDDSRLGTAPGSATAGHLTLNGGTLLSTADFTLNANRGVALGSSHGTFNVNSGTVLTVAGVIAGSNNLIKLGAGTLLLSGTNTYTGYTNIDAGKVQVTGTLSSSTTVDNEGVFDVDSTNTVASVFGSGNVELASGITLTTGDTNNRTISGVVSGSGNLVKTGSGTLTLSGTNTYTGTTTISSGTLNILADSGLGAAPGSATPGHLTLNGGTLRTPNTFTLNSNRGITLGSSHGTFNVHGSSTLTYGGIIAGSGSLTKVGTGTLVLTSQLSTYSGGTVNDAGTLRLAAASIGSIGSASSGPIGTGSLTNNAILDVDGNLIHNTKTNSGSIINKPSPSTSFSSASLAVIYGDSVSNSFTTDSNGAKTFSSSNTSSATINSSNGTVTLVRVGDTTMSVSLAETDEYQSATDSYTITISPKTLTATASASNKVYDGLTTATTTLTFSGLIGSETLGQTVGSTFSDKNVGTGKTVTVNSITLADGSNGGLAANYSISTGQTTTANITAKSLTVSGITASNKTYDSTTSATLGTGSVSYGGLVSGDDFTGSYSGVFANANVGTGKTVNITSSYSGADVSNYSVTDQSTTTANITAKALTATASASNKVYNGSSAATVTLSLSGFIGSETVTSTNSSTFSDKNVATGKTVTVNSITLADGTNGGLAANYSISTGQTTTANITAKALTVSGITTSNKIYDGNSVATLNTSSVAYSGLVSGDTFNGTYTGAFSDKNVGTGKTVTITPSYSGADVSNYSITNHADLTANITVRSLTVSGVAASDKTYDGSVTATMDSSSAVYSGFVSGDDFAASYSGVFANANVGTGKTVTITSSYAGADVSNYNITDQTSTTADINKKVLLLSTFSASNKAYDGNNTPTITSAVSGFVGSETVSHSITATFDNKNVGSNKVVTANSITLADGTNGGLASNYSISTGQTTTANITAKSLTATASASNKVYDGLTTATTTLTFSGLIGSETLGQTVGSTFSDKNVGTGKTVTVNSIALADGTNGGLAGNYSISPGQTTTANITAKALTVSGLTASNKTYDSTTSATLVSSSVSYSGLITGDVFIGSYTGVFANANVGTGKTINITSSYSGADAGNYSVTDQSSTTANITAKVLTATASASNKTYDGGTTATTTLTFSGLIGSETLGQTVASTFDNKNVGTAKTVTVNSITLADGTNGGLAANYSISAGQTTTANITTKSLTVSGVTASNKTYDGGTNASMDGTSAVYSGLVSGDTFNGTYTGAFSDKNVGTGKTVTITSSYSGADVSNYSVTDQSSTTANITAKALTVSGITASSKTYDGSTSATLDSTSVTYTGLLSGDTFTGSYSGVFANANVGTGKTVNITSSYSGTDSGNYSVTDQSSTTADISTKALTATASASNKTYDGGTTATTTLILSGLIGSETLTSSTSSSFNNKNVGTGKAVTVNSITLADGTNGGLAANYSISAGQTTTANITAKSLTVSGITASNKIYDGNTVATLDSSSVTYSGLVSGDSFAGSYSGLFSDKNIGTGKTVTISSSYSGSDVNNYTVTDQSSTTANITSRPLGVTGITVFGLTVNNKEYDGTVTAPLDTSSISYSGLVDGDDFTGSYSGVFANANVGNGKAVTITSSYSGADAGNYSVTDQSSTTGNIVPKVLTATASASNKTYDGGTTATTTLTFSGLIGSETLGQTVASTFNNKNVGTGKTVTVNSITLADGTNGGLAANYSISAGQTTTANITAKSLTVSGITASNKTYDGSTNVTLDPSSVAYSGLVSGDTFNGTYTGAFSDKNVGTGKTVTITSSYSGADVNNYNVTDQSSTTANITAKALTVSGITASSKTYDGSTSATLDSTSVTYTGLLSGDTFTGSYTGAFSNANVGTGKTVTITSSYSGADVSNYSVTNQSSTTADISAKTLTATASASNKTYDGGTTATTTLTFTGLVGSETLGQTVGSTFDNKNVGSNKTVTVNSITLADGSNGGLAANYSISAGQTTTANITAKSLTVSGITASNKTYDGNSVASLDASSVAYSGLVSGDTFNGTFIGTFSDKNVGSGKTVTITPTYSGADVSNYSITNHADVTANITAKSLTVSGVTASDKTYDGSVTATMDSSSAVYSGFVSGDDFTGSYSGVFANANVANGKTVTITSSYSGADVSNYNITDQTSTTANISAKALTATASASNKVYDGSSAATSTLTLSGFVGSETVTSTNSSTFNNKNVGTGKTVTVNSITLADGTNGGLATNYSISTGQTTTANVTAKALTVSGITASNKVYDSSTNATTTLSFSGLIGSETINNTNSSTFDNKNIGTGKTVTVNSITLVDGSNGGLASNYSISSGQTTTANVSARPLTVSNISASNKSYDGTKAVTLDTSNVSYNGLVSGDDFSGSFSGVFANENIGTGRIVNITSSYSGDDIGNYSITNQNTHFANITIGNPTISGLSDQEKTFTSSSYTLTGTPSISGLPIVYSSSDNSIATVNSTTGEVTFANVGTVTISANILSTLNYNSATSSYTLEINLNATNINNITSNVVNSSASSNASSSTSLSSTLSTFLASKNLNLRTISIQNGGSIKAKIVVIENNADANVDAIYDENTLGNKITRDFKDEEEKEKFDEPGEVIDEKTFILKISETNSYNYKLEYREKGLVIKPLNYNSKNFLKNSKQIVIDAAISRASQIVGFIKKQIKTIIIDFGKSFVAQTDL